MTHSMKFSGTKQRNVRSHKRKVSRQPPYPRGRIVLTIRWILLGCWSIICSYVGNVIWNWVLLSPGPLQLSDPKTILSALSLPFLAGPLQQAPWIIVAAFILFWLLLVSCIWATSDYARERIWQRRQDVYATVSHALSKEDGKSPRDESELLPLLPDAPFDIGRLPTTEVFIDRQEHLDWLNAELNKRGRHNPIVLYGMAGVGKTALVTRATRQMYNERRFPDGIVFYPCQGQNDAFGILRKVLGRFDTQRRYGGMTDDTLDWNDIASVLFAGKNALVILDNLEPAVKIEALVAPLRNAGVTILITARHKPAEPSIQRKIGQLSLSEAMDLFMRSCQRESSLTNFTSAQRSAAESIVRDLGCHALAVKLAGAQAAIRDIELLAQELHDPQQAIELPDGETPRVVALVFSESTKALPPKALKLFTAMAAFPTLDFSRNAVLALGTRLGITDVKFALQVLFMRALVETSVLGHMSLQSDRERLYQHPLLRAFATARFNHWSQKERNAVFLAIAEYYASYTNTNIPYNLLSADEMNITGMLKWVHKSQVHDLEISLCTGMQEYLYHRPATSGGQDYLRWGVEAAKDIASRSQTSQDLLREANLSFRYAQTLQRDGDIEHAEGIYKTDLQLRRQMKDHRGEAEVLVCLVQIALQRGELSDAANYCKQSNNITLGNQLHNKEMSQYNESSWLACQSQISWRRGRLEEAEDYSYQSLEILQRLSDKHREAECLIRLGNIAQDRGHMRDARAHYTDAQHIIQEIQDRQLEGWLYRSIGTLARAMDDPRRAEECAHRAQIILRETQDSDGEGWVLGDLGLLAQGRKALQNAEEAYLRALENFRGVQDRHGEAWILGNLGNLAQERGEHEMVEDYYREALRLGQEGEDMLNWARVALALGVYLIVVQTKQEEGCRLLKEAERMYTSLGLTGDERLLKKARTLILECS